MRATHPSLQHGTQITLTAINEVIHQRMNAALLELMLGSGLPLPAVPRGSKQRSIAMWDGEYGSSSDVRGLGSGGRRGRRTKRRALCHGEGCQAG